MVGIEQRMTQAYLCAVREGESYTENGRLVFTERYHIRRGHCCGSGCRHCPFLPRHQKFNQKLDPKVLQQLAAENKADKGR